METKLKHNVPTDFSKTVFYKIEQLSIYTQMLAKNFFEIRKIDLNSDEFAAMNFIINNPGICQRDLAKLILRDRVRTGRIISSLEEKGFVERINNTKNNRLVKMLKITVKGKRMYDKQFSIMSQLFDKMLDKFSEDKMTELMTTLTELEKVLAEVVELNI